MIEQKIPFSQSLSTFAAGKVADGSQLQGQVLPCSVLAVDGAIVTVAFEVTSDQTLPQVTCPIAESRYVRIPVQVGDKGILIAASVRLGGISGLGTGLANLNVPSNLGGLVFLPISNKIWATLDANAVVIEAPNGAIIKTDDGAAVVSVTSAGVSVSFGGASITLAGGNVEIDGTLIINGTPFLSHTHNGVRAGADNSGGVN